MRHCHSDLYENGSLIVTPEDDTVRAETCNVILLIFEYTSKIDVVLYGFLNFLLLYGQCTTGWSTLKLTL
jgi:hypothetical protein